MVSLMVSVVGKVGESSRSVVAPVHINGVHANEVTGIATGQEGDVQVTNLLLAITIVHEEISIRVVDFNREVIVALTVSLDASDPLEVTSGFLLQYHDRLIVLINGGHQQNVVGRIQVQGHTGKLQISRLHVVHVNLGRNAKVVLTGGNQVLIKAGLRRLTSPQCQTVNGWLAPSWVAELPVSVPIAWIQAVLQIIAKAMFDGNGWGTVDWCWYRVNW